MANWLIFDDKTGKRVRKYHAYRLGGSQPCLWEDIEEITPQNMDKAKTLRRDGVVATCVQIMTDLDYFNTHCNPGDPIIFDPNLTNDVLDQDQPTTYEDPSSPDDDDGSSE